MHAPRWVWTERTAAALLVALWMICCWRAATQSITHDEALTYQLYIAGPADAIFHYFDANHHFLNTVLMRLSAELFGISELALRIPALLGAALYFSAVFRFCRWAFGLTALFVLAVAAASLNPLVLDFLVVARGYALALGLWMWALALIGPAANPKQAALAGMCAGLSVTANLVFVLPAAVLAACVIWLLWRVPADTMPREEQERAPKRRHPLWMPFLEAATAVGFVFILAAPLEDAHRGHFYVGTRSVAASLRNLTTMSLSRGQPKAYLDAVAFVVAPAVVLAAAVLGWRRRKAALVLAAVPAAGAAVTILLLHAAAGMPYPIDRTGIYFLPAFALSLAGLASILTGKARSCGLAALAVAALAFALQFDTRSFAVWTYDADSREIATRLAQAAHGRQARIANSWQLEPSLDYYRDKNHWTDLPQFMQRIAPGADYYALIPEDQASIASMGLRPVYTGPVSGTVVAVAK